jgi:hypothetical protein
MIGRGYWCDAILAASSVAEEGFMIRNLFTAIGVVVVATALAAGSVWWKVERAPLDGVVHIGPWQTNPAAGSVDAGLYVRARIARDGLFALNRAEAIYFMAARDDDNRPLRARCVYLIEGRTVAARWWSITAYADDHFLIPNAANRFSFNMGNLKLGPDGAFRVIAAPTAQAGDWLPTGEGSGGFNLLFRLYNPAPAIAADPSIAALPSIKRMGACP